MKNVLILSYYFPPCNGAPSWRPYSWAKNFHRYGINPFVITRHWTGNENTWEDFLVENLNEQKLEVHEDYSVLYVPSKILKFNVLLNKNKLLAKLFGNIYFILLGLIGRFNTEVDAYLSFKVVLKDHLKVNKYDAIIISSPPSNILQLVKIAKRNSDAKIIVDYRDLWNNLILTLDYKPDLKQRVWDFLYQFYYRIWLKNVDLVTVIIEPFKDIIGRLSGAPMKVVFNGFESQVFNGLTKSRNKKFTFSVVGNIYPQQNTDILLNGLDKFLEGKSSDKIDVKFIGAEALPEVANRVKAVIPTEFLTITGRVSKQMALQETLDADVLSYCGWKGVKGIVSTKAFDYIASGNYVLIAPGDDDALDNLILECECGISVNSVEEFVSKMEELYSYWLLNGELKKVGNREKIEFYSRENQAHIMANYINELVG